MKEVVPTHAVFIRYRRTSVRIEPELWVLLEKIIAIENCTNHQIHSYINDNKVAGRSYSSALRVFIAQYFSRAAERAGASAAEGLKFDLSLAGAKT